MDTFNATRFIYPALMNVSCTRSNGILSFILGFLVLDVSKVLISGLDLDILARKWLPFIISATLTTLPLATGTILHV